MGTWADYQVPGPGVYRKARLGRITMQPGEVRGMPLQTTFQLLFVHTGEAHVLIGSGAHAEGAGGTTALGRGAHAGSAGEAHVLIGGRVALPVPAGSAVLLRPRDFSHRRTIGSAPSRQSWLAAVPDALTAEQLAALDAAPALRPLSPALDGVRASALRVATDLDAARVPAEEPLLALIVGALLLYVEEARRAGALTGAGHSHPAVGAARETVRRRLNERIGLREMAAAAHVSPEHLVRLFRQELGTTPGRYLWAERVRAGVHLLEHSVLPVAEVAHRAGFQTASHFTRTVRRAVGLRPGELRRRSASPAAAAGDVVL